MHVLVMGKVDLPAHFLATSRHRVAHPSVFACEPRRKAAPQASNHGFGFTQPRSKTNSYFRAIHRTMLVNAASPRKISNPFSGWVGPSKSWGKVIMPTVLIVEDDVLANEHLEFILQRTEPHLRQWFLLWLHPWRYPYGL
jgi:hypothetical protein